MPITELRIQGLRTLENIRLKLDGLMVLIGENGSGKSSIIEACEILRRAIGENFLDEFHTIHGGMASLLRQGADRLSLGVSLVPDPSSPDTFSYDLSLTAQGAFAVIERESLVKLFPGGEAVVLIERGAAKVAGTLPWPW